MTPNGNQPAYPQHLVMEPLHHDWHYGLTKREEFAKAAMQGMCGDSSRDGSHQAFAEDAVKFADALLAELERTSKP